MGIVTTEKLPVFNDEIRYRARNGKIVVIRPVTLEDAKDIVKQMKRVVEEESYLEEEADTLGSVQEERESIRKMKDSGHMYTVAEVDEEVVGVAQLFRGTMEMSAHTANFRTWLSKRFRGMGIGKRFMEYSICWGQEQGLEKICLDVFSNNERAIELYKKYGFILEGRRRQQHVLDGKYVDEIFMSLFINKGSKK